jgi:hypothetical protein
MGRCDLDSLGDRNAYLRAIADYAASHPDEEWIRGGGWAMAAFPGGTPVKEDLDAVVSDRPVFLTNRDGHGAWVNTRALERAGISAGTPDPARGRIERHPDGTPSGMLHEKAMDAVVRLMPPLSDEELRAGLERAQRDRRGGAVGEESRHLRESRRPG